MKVVLYSEKTNTNNGVQNAQRDILLDKVEAKQNLDLYLAFQAISTNEMTKNLQSEFFGPSNYGKYALVIKWVTECFPPISHCSRDI